MLRLMHRSAPAHLRDPDRVRRVSCRVLLAGAIWRRAIRSRPSCRRMRRTEVIDKLKAHYGFDKPLPVQFLLWLGVALTGDFGTLDRHRRPVLERVALGASATPCMLAVAAVPLAFSLGCRAGRAGRPFRQVAIDRTGWSADRGGRRQPAALLARHRAGHHLRRRARLPCRHGHGAGELDGWRCDWDASRAHGAADRRRCR